MSSLSIDDKLVLIQKMRNHANENTVHTSRRNQDLYDSYRFASKEGEEEEVAGMGFRLFKFRFCVCLLLLVTFWGLSKTTLKFKGHSVSDAAVVLQEDKLPNAADKTLESWASSVKDSFRQSFKQK